MSKATITIEHEGQTSVVTIDDLQTVEIKNSFGESTDLRSLRQLVHRGVRTITLTSLSTVTEKPAVPVQRSCNRHSDCGKADAEAKAKGAFGASHCHDDECEDCFGC